VDGGHDENPRYRESIKFACANFLHLGLDALGGRGFVLYNLGVGVGNSVI